MIFKSFDCAVGIVYGDAYANVFLSLKEYSGKEAVAFFEKILSRSLKRFRKLSARPELLDIGSGIGLMLRVAILNGYNATGVELSSKLSDKAKMEGFKIINKNISEVAIDRTFDTVTMMDVIEHLEEPQATLSKIHELLKKEGELIVYTPNHDSLIVKIANLLYRLGIRRPVETIFGSSHVCFFTTETLIAILRRSGFQILDVLHFNYDTTRPGQEISCFEKICINIIEILGKITYSIFRTFKLAGLPLVHG